MSSKKLPLCVVDTCVLLGLLFEEDNGQERAARAEQLFDTNGDTQRLIVPSIVELEIASHSRVRLPNSTHESDRVAKVNETLAQIRKFNIMSADLTSRVASCAAGLIPSCNIKWPDAVIVGTALAYEAAHVYTWDDKLINSVCKPVGELGVAVCHPPRVTQTALNL